MSSRKSVSEFTGESLPNTLTCTPLCVFPEEALLERKNVVLSGRKSNALLIEIIGSLHNWKKCFSVILITRNLGNKVWVTSSSSTNCHGQLICLHFNLPYFIINGKNNK